MKKLFFILSIIGIIASGCSNISQTINPVIGDISFIEKFGKLPDKLTNENLRIKTHLEYVEKLLRSKNTSGLSDNLKSARAFLLDKLHEYWTAGNFPKNYDHPEERKPCFIDKDGNICAVGYLVEQSSGRLLAEAINHEYKYDKIRDMHLPDVSEWIQNSGLTAEECAMIQPTYGYPNPVEPVDNNSNQISTAYAIGGSVLDGVNLSFSALNLLQIFKGSDNKVVPALSILSGAGSVALGIANMGNDETYDYWGTSQYNHKKIFSIVNIGIGSASMTLGIANLLMNKPKKDKKMSWNFYSLQHANNSLGIQVVRRF